MLTAYIVVLVVLMVAICLIVYFGVSLCSGIAVVCVCFMSSALCLVGCCVLVVFAPGYQRYNNAKRLYEKYNGVKDMKNNRLVYEPFMNSKVFKACAWILKSRPFPSSIHLVILLFTISILFVLVPYGEWDNAIDNKFFTFFYVLSGLFRNVMQVFVVDGGLTDFVENIKILSLLTNGGKGVYLIYTSCLLVFAGFLFTFKIVNLIAKEFKAYWDYWVMHRLSDIYVMSELNNRSIAVAESIFLSYYIVGKQSYNSDQDIVCQIKNKEKRAKHVKIYFCDVDNIDREKNSALLKRAEQMGAVVMKRNIDDIKLKWHCKSNKFCMIGYSEERNIIYAQKISSLYNQKKFKKRLDIYIYASRPESEYIIDDMHQNEM